MDKCYLTVARELPTTRKALERSIKKYRCDRDDANIMIDESVIAEMKKNGVLVEEYVRVGGVSTNFGYAINWNGQEEPFALLSVVHKETGRHSVLVDKKILEQLVAFRFDLDRKALKTKINGKYVRLHRLAFNLMNGSTPNYNKRYHIHHKHLKCLNIVSCMKDTRDQTSCHTGNGGWSHSMGIEIRDDNTFYSFINYVADVCVAFEIFDKDNLY